MPSTRRLARESGVLALLVVAVTAPAAAQSPEAAELSLGTRIGIRFVVILVVNVLLGGALVVLGPEYAADTVAELRDDPGSAFGWGLLVGIGGPIAMVLLAITVIGLVVAIPGLFVLAFVGLVGNAVTVVWVGSGITSGWTATSGRSVLAGATLLAVVGAVPVLGNIVTSLAGFFGMGVVGRRLYESWRG